MSPSWISIGADFIANEHGHTHSPIGTAIEQEVNICGPTSPSRKIVKNDCGIVRKVVPGRNHREKRVGGFGWGGRGVRLGKK